MRGDKHSNAQEFVNISYWNININNFLYLLYVCTVYSI
jgi:hypothetical protein